MTEYIKNQLRKCRVACVNFQDGTYEYLIKQYKKPKYLIGKCYLIKVSNEIINNSTTLLAINWNNGGSPKSQFYKAYVSKCIGKTIYCDCLAYDPVNNTDKSEIWSGYLDIDYLEQLAEL